MPEEPWLPAADAARRLGVQPSTLYAYVSRGQLRRRAAADGRRSEYHPGDVAGLAVRGRRARPSRPSDIIVPTAVTRITDRGPMYRGRVAVDDAGVRPFEVVADHLWGVEHGVPWSVEGARPTVTGDAVGELEPCDRLIPVVAALRVADPLRDDLRPPVVVATARRLIAAIVTAVSRDHAAPDAVGTSDRQMAMGVHGRSLGGRLARGQGADDPSAGVLVDAAMVLLADHELASSTLAVRVAASARCDPYAAVLAGLAVVSGARHGGASRPLELALGDVADGMPADHALERRSRDGVVPGFGHPLYPGGDPRAVRLLDLLDDGPLGVPASARAVLDAARRRGFPPPSIDVSLAAVTHATGAPVGTGELIFSVARIAGWVAHALEQYEDERLLRPTAVYVGG